MCSAVWGDAVDRLALDQLEATHAAVAGIRQDWRPVAAPNRYEDCRAVLHVHSKLSHDSRSEPDEIRQAARATGVKVVLFNEHPAPHYDFVTDGHRGLQDGMLFIPGAEFGGLLAYPQDSLGGREFAEPQARVDAVNAARGMAFLCHLEERLDWDLDGLTGSEIYNVHADFKEEARLVKTLATPAGLLSLAVATRRYPQETMAALQDYPTDYLRRWDELCRKSRLTGVAGNDAHHNQVLRATLQANGELELVDALGKSLGTLNPNQLPLVKPFLLGLKTGEAVTLMDLDPYERSFRYVSTHLFLTELTEPAVREALQAGRAYVSFDWLADPTGFHFQAVNGEQVFEMGSEVRWSAGLRLRSASPLPARFRLLKDGQEIDAQLGRTFDYAIHEPGSYRVEVWVNLPDGPRVWVLSNPIYIRPSSR
jgi:hypothetical protein